MSKLIGHDVIVAGASAGGVEALSGLVCHLPEDLPASLVVVLHTLPYRKSILDEILKRRAALPVCYAEDGAPLECGRVYIAPPNHHLIVKPGHLRLTRGPRENYHRPAVDPTFRSAAASYASRVVGVVLSGMLDDGSAGLLDIKRCGGVAMVQDPDDARYPSMPLCALQNVEVDYCLSAEDLGKRLLQVTREPAPEPLEIPKDVLLEVRFAEGAAQTPHPLEPDGRVVPMACPECGGSLREVLRGHTARYRCRVGHAFTSATLLSGQDMRIESALWQAARVMRDERDVLRRLTRRARHAGRDHEAASYEAAIQRLQDREQRVLDILFETCEVPEPTPEA